MEEDPSVLAGTFQSRQMLEQSEKALDEILAAFDLMAKRIANGEGDLTNAELTKAKTTLGHARTQIVDEVTRHEKRILQSPALSQMPPSTLTRCDLRSGANLIASGKPEEQRDFLESLGSSELRALPYLFDFWAMPHQLAPEGDWKTWVILGGRGAGKTRAGSEWVRSQVEGALPEDAGRCQRVALVGETFDQARDVMVFGESGILECSPPDRRPVWEAGKRQLVRKNGATAKVYSAYDYDGLRGPQFYAAWVDEVGCAAIDKGTNQPNKFLDPKSSESSLPNYSNGARDDLIQMQYLRAVTEYWDDPAHNPVSASYGAPMVATDRMFLWAWDARPYPYFPSDFETWSDGENYARGHWLNGRVATRSLAAVIKEICVASGVDAIDVSGVHGLVRGYTLDGGGDARSALQPLLLVYGVDAIEKNGLLIFRNRVGVSQKALVQNDLAWGEAPSLVAKSRAPQAEISGRVRLTYVDADGDYEVRGVEGVFPDDDAVTVSHSEVSLALTKGEAQGVVERWLAEARVARDTVSFALPPSQSAAAGDVVDVEGDSYRIDRVEDAGLKIVEGVRIERGLYQRATASDDFTPKQTFTAPLPVWAAMMDLPLLRSGDVPDAPWLVASSEPWPGEVAVYSSLDGSSWTFNSLLSRRAVMGTTQNAMEPAKAGLIDRGPGLDVSFVAGALTSVDQTAFLAGSNAAVIGAPGRDWEVFQFQDAELIGPDTWSLSTRLRGQRGSEAAMSEIWEPGATVVVLDSSALQVAVPSELRGVLIKYRLGPANKPVDHNAYVEFEHASRARGLRPYAPVRLTSMSDGAGGRTFNWIRRTRVDGDNWSLADVPLGEAYEAYQIRVVSGGQVLRAETVPTPAWTYSAADRSADGVTGSYDVEVAQISDLYGPGDFARILIDG